jgi:hypothetical protein
MHRELIAVEALRTARNLSPLRLLPVALGLSSFNCRGSMMLLHRFPKGSTDWGETTTVQARVGEHHEGFPSNEMTAFHRLGATCRAGVALNARAFP